MTCIHCFSKHDVANEAISILEEVKLSMMIRRAVSHETVLYFFDATHHNCSMMPLASAVAWQSEVTDVLVGQSSTFLVNPRPVDDSLLLRHATIPPSSVRTVEVGSKRFHDRVLRIRLAEVDMLPPIRQIQLDEPPDRNDFSIGIASDSDSGSSRSSICTFNRCVAAAYRCRSGKRSATTSSGGMFRQK